MIDRLFYIAAAACVVAAVVLFAVVAYEWLKELKEHAASVDNVYPLQRRSL